MYVLLVQVDIYENFGFVDRISTRNYIVYTIYTNTIGVYKLVIEQYSNTSEGLLELQYITTLVSSSMPLDAVCYQIAPYFISWISTFLEDVEKFMIGLPMVPTRYQVVSNQLKPQTTIPMAQVCSKQIYIYI